MHSVQRFPRSWPAFKKRMLSFTDDHVHIRVIICNLYGCIHSLDWTGTLDYVLERFKHVHLYVQINFVK